LYEKTTNLYLSSNVRLQHIASSRARQNEPLYIQQLAKTGIEPMPISSKKVTIMLANKIK